jgi:hypothetical protein
MTTTSEGIPMTEEQEITTPAAWTRALIRFEMAYGAEPDLQDAEDQFAFLGLLEEVLRERMAREVVRAFELAAEQAEARLREEAP